MEGRRRDAGVGVRYKRDREEGRREGEGTLGRKREGWSERSEVEARQGGGKGRKEGEGAVEGRRS